MRYNEILKETRYAPLYHWMDAGKSLKVFKTDQLLPLFSHKMIGQKGISTTRNKKYKHHNGREVCLVLDQDIVRTTNKIIPLDSTMAIHFDNQRKKKSYAKLPAARHTMFDNDWDDENSITNYSDVALDRADNFHSPKGTETAEEYIIGSLIPLHRYLKSIILYNWVNEGPFIEYLLKYVKKFNISLEVTYMPGEFWRSYGDENVAESNSLELPTIDVGDTLMVGKFKNRKATVKGFKKDFNKKNYCKKTESSC